MERLCSTNGAGEEGGSIFSFTFPDSFVEDLWDHDYELECDETDQDQTLTTTTLTLQTDTTPNSSSARKIITDFSSEERNGHFRFYQQQNGTASSSTITSHNNSITRNGHSSTRPHIGYASGQLMPVSFNGYFRQTAV